MISFGKHLFFGLLFITFSCEEILEEKAAFGGKKYGGVFTYFSPEKTKVFFPLHSPTLYNQRVLSQIFEPLFILNEHGKVIPNVSRGLQKNGDGNKIILKLRNDVYFHDDACFSGNRRMTAKDVKFSLSFACSGNNLNSLGALLRDKIQGGRAFYKKSIHHIPNEGVTGITILNDSTIQLNLTSSFSNFKKLLAHPSLVIFSKEAYLYYKNDIINHPIGTGPFILKSSNSTGIVLTRNNDYWKKDVFGNQLPFLSEIHIKHSKGIHSEYRAFSKKETDILFQLPVNQLDQTFGSLIGAQKGKNLLHRVIVKKGTKINYLSFDCASFPFNDLRVRKAFSLAIDRRKICIEAMNGEGNYNINGFVPKNNYYQPNELELLSFNPREAKKLMLKAGFSDQNRFPKLTLYINAQKGSMTDKWSKEITRELMENLGVELEIKYCSLTEKHEVIMSRKAKIWKSAWVPDYPDADAYFRVFYSNLTGIANEESNYNNFNNEIFDSIYEVVERTKEPNKRLNLQNKLDRILIENGAVVPIFSEDLFVVVNLRVRDFQINDSGIIDFSRIYIKEVF
jgi:peptide/nickel transport system substrate-binding protein